MCVAQYTRAFFFSRHCKMLYWLYCIQCLCEASDGFPGSGSCFVLIQSSQVKPKDKTKSSHLELLSVSPVSNKKHLSIMCSNTLLTYNWCYVVYHVVYQCTLNTNELSLLLMGRMVNDSNIRSLFNHIILVIIIIRTRNCLPDNTMYFIILFPCPVLTDSEDLKLYN